LPSALADGEFLAKANTHNQILRDNLENIKAVLVSHQDKFAEGNNLCRKPAVPVIADSDRVEWVGYII
jgi:hypothetical protein